MLSAIRRALGRPPRFTYRGLSTAPEIDLSLAALAQDVPLAPSQVLKEVLHGAPSGSSTSNPFNPPVYVTMSSLLQSAEAGEAGPPPPSDNLVELDPFIFSHHIRRDILHLCVVHHLDSLRQGSANTKTRGEVRGSGRKIRPQKGTGRARLGDGQSPMLRGGGVAFGPKPRDFSTKLNRKVIQMGMRVALSARVKENSLGIVESLDWPGGKTRDLMNRLQELGWEKALFVSGRESVPEGLLRASSNISKVETTTASSLKVYDVVKWPRVILDLAAVEYFERTLGKPTAPPRVYSV